MSDESQRPEQGPRAELRAFIDACRTSRDEARAMLAANPRLIHDRLPLSEETALHFCAIEEDIEAVRWLLAAGADIETRNDELETPLSDAAWLGNLEMTRFLLDSGADIESADEQGQTPLFRAASGGHEGVVRLLVSRGADVRKRNHDGRAPLDEAVFFEHTSVVRALVEGGADLEALGKFGMTPLNLAVAWHFSPEVARVLVELGANAFEPGGLTLLEIARERLEKEPDDPGLQEMVRFLESLEPPAL